MVMRMIRPSGTYVTRVAELIEITYCDVLFRRVEIGKDQWGTMYTKTKYITRQNYNYIELDNTLSRTQPFYIVDDTCERRPTINRTTQW